MNKLLIGWLIVLSIIIILIILINLILSNIYTGSSRIKFGATFSPEYARYLKLDWQKTYIQVLDGLKVRNLRIPGYWDTLEPQPDTYDFSETDYMLDEAGKRSAKVILVLGARQPRWPECQIPLWAQKLSVSQRQQKVLGFVRTIVNRYKDHPAVWAWQVENEPMLGFFGEGCDEPDVKFLKQETALVKSLSSKPIIMTDSGELGLWKTSMQLSDIFGTTLYRQVYDKSFGRLTYPLPPYFYSLKSGLIRNIFARSNKETIVAEFQAEPWLAEGKLLGAEQQARIFPVETLGSYIGYVRKTGFNQVYLWGVEWWYWMDKQGHPQYLEYTKSLFK